MLIPTLVTERLTLRPFTMADVDALQQVMAPAEVMRYFPNPQPPDRARVERLIAGQLQHWEDHGLGWWVVEPRGKAELIGWIGLQYLPETHETEVGFLLAQPWWGQGLASEGVVAALHFCFDELHLRQIVAVVHPQNRRSQRVIEKLGMRLTGEAVYFGMAVLRYELDSPLPAAEERG